MTDTDRHKERNEKLLAKAREIAAALGPKWHVPDPRESREDGDWMEINFLEFLFGGIGAGIGGWIDTYRNRHEITAGRLGKADFGLYWPRHLTTRDRPRGEDGKIRGYGPVLDSWTTHFKSGKGSGYMPPWWTRSEHGDNLTAGVGMERPAADIARDLKRRLRLDEYTGGWFAEALAGMKKSIAGKDAAARDKLRVSKKLDNARIDGNHERPYFVTGKAGPGSVHFGDEYGDPTRTVEIAIPVEYADRAIRFLKGLAAKPAEEPAPAFETLDLFALAA